VVVSRSIVALPEPPEVAEGNPIHGDEVAAQVGYDGALVSGVHTYGWATDAVVDALGEAWLDHGWADVFLKRPVYEGERITTTVDDDGALITANWETFREGTRQRHRLALDARLARGDEQLEMKQTAAALEIFQEAVEFAPDSAEAVAGLVITYLSRNDPDAALGALSTNRSLFEGRRAGAVLRAESLSTAGRVEEAEAVMAGSQSPAPPRDAISASSSRAAASRRSCSVERRTRRVPNVPCRLKG